MFWTFDNPSQGSNSRCGHCLDRSNQCRDFIRGNKVLHSAVCEISPRKNRSCKACKIWQQIIFLPCCLKTRSTLFEEDVQNTSDRCFIYILSVHFANSSRVLVLPTVHVEKSALLYKT